MLTRPRFAAFDRSARLLRKKGELMRFIPTRIHGVPDYLLGILLIALPWLLNFDFADNGAETWVPVILGAGVILYSPLTDYELGAIHTIPMRVHLLLDGLGRLLLAISPWLVGFADTVWVPFVVLGLLEIGAAVLTQTVPRYGRRAEFWESYWISHTRPESQELSSVDQFQTRPLAVESPTTSRIPA
jgi:hypothetical protein